MAEHEIMWSAGHHAGLLDWGDCPIPTSCRAYILGECRAMWGSPDKVHDNAG